MGWGCVVGAQGDTGKLLIPQFHQVPRLGTEDGQHGLVDPL